MSQYYLLLAGKVSSRRQSLKGGKEIAGWECVEGGTPNFVFVLSC